MRRTFVVTTPATDLALLSIEELRDAVGLDAAEDTSSDWILQELGYRAADTICTECGIAIAAGHRPTLLRERLTETFKSASRETELFLSRRHEISIVSITTDGTTESADDYDVDPETGLLAKYSSGRCWDWTGTAIVVVYDAGFTSPPGDLKQAATEFVKANFVRDGRDPSLKSETIDIPDVERVERAWWVGSTPGQKVGALPESASAVLGRYRNVPFA